ncbi:hypothetical protein ET33_30865 [Paenibacillus tyrfis]|uniref:Uncharacterized protein n=1 Tax=Paenibacillus tyrfis TaxID=1501230 RepID=A0A081NTP0_9BACL|nr:hypothetical protein ET33_30865 [Paenibacillus tyrfis]
MLACSLNDSLLSFCQPRVLKGFLISNHAFIFKQTVINFAVFVIFLLWKCGFDKLFLLFFFNRRQRIGRLGIAKPQPIHHLRNAMNRLISSKLAIGVQCDDLQCPVKLSGEADFTEVMSR